ncbi:MAG: di-heme oxidoredictase family protein [Gemmobacter sp.]
MAGSVGRLWAILWLSAAGTAAQGAERVQPVAYAAEAPAAARVALGWNEFRRQWVPTPEISQWDGLGPLFNARACLDCHMGPALGGRVVMPDLGPVAAPGMVLRLGTETGEGHPALGRQLQTLGTGGARGEGRLALGRSGVGAEARPQVSAILAEPPADLRLAPLLAPPLIGRAAIDRVDEGAIVALAAQQAAEGRVAGRVQRVTLPDGTEAVGRYGVAAGRASLAAQIADAFALDMGLSSVFAPGDAGDCTATQTRCHAAPHGPDPWRAGHEVASYEIELIAAFLADKPAPAQRRAAPAPEAALFAETGCADCHVPQMPDSAGEMVTLYSDLLLHDMGQDLARPFGAEGALWRTSPLLALGPYPGRRYLHDGRAGDIDGAIRAHGGEAAAAQARYAALPEGARARLIAFLEGL